jgi:hypothetical protein
VFTISCDCVKGNITIIFYSIRLYCWTSSFRWSFWEYHCPWSWSWIGQGFDHCYGKGSCCPCQHLWFVWKLQEHR